MKAYDLQTVDNPSLIKRFSHRRRFDLAVRLLAPSVGQTLFDYGTGDARLLLRLAEVEPQARYIGYEPVAEMRAQAQPLLQQAPIAIPLLGTRSELAGIEADTVSCQEVMEHLDEASLSAAFEDFRALLAADGRLVISVPLEVGPTALAKNLVRIAASQAQEGTSLFNIVNATLGRSERIDRTVRSGYIESHIGFDYRVLRRRLAAEGFAIEREIFAPLRVLGPLLNSQVFWVCRRR